MSISLGGKCGCCGCSPCNDSLIPAYLTLEFAGLAAQQCSVDTDCDTVNDTPNVMDLSGLNGTGHQFDLIYHNGTYVAGYNTGTMGEVSSRGGAEGDCISCYEQEFTGLGHLYLPVEGGCPGNHWNEDDYKLDDVSLRLRIYVEPDGGGAGIYEMTIVPIYPDNGGTDYAELGSANIVVTWNSATDTWFCTASGEYDSFEADGVDWRYLQMLNMVFWSDSDTRLSGLDPTRDTNVFGTPSCLDVTVPMTGDGTTTWTLTASATRVAGAE